MMNFLHFMHSNDSLSIFNQNYSHLESSDNIKKKFVGFMIYFIVIIIVKNIDNSLLFYYYSFFASLHNN